MSNNLPSSLSNKLSKTNIHSNLKNYYSLKKHSKYYLAYNLFAFLLVVLGLIFISWNAVKMHAPLQNIEITNIDLDLANLFFYASSTTMRMLIGIFFAIIFSLLYGTLAAKNKYAEQILVPLLDVLQSVPILGYISFTVTIFLSLFPGNMLGLECAAIFAIFTSQVWNITFSFYQSLKTTPPELIEAAYIFNMSSWQKFWRVEVPFAMPNLIWNSVLSMSGAWFFVVASEVINVGDNNIKLPGIGSYIALALSQQNTKAIIYAVITMSLTILVYNQLIINPLVAWADKFKTESSKSNNYADSWLLNLFKRNLIIKKLFLPLIYLKHFLLYFSIFNYYKSKRYKEINYKKGTNSQDYSDYIWYFVLFITSLYSSYLVYDFMHATISLSEVIKVMHLACLTMLRVIMLIIIASVIWVPIGIYIGLNPKLARLIDPIIQFLASFPANLLFPIAVISITKYNLNPDIWLSPLIIMGAQWYILFNVISGTAAIPNELKEVAMNLKLSKILYLRKVILPAIAPYFVTGAITASGGAWNASIVAELVSFGSQTISAKGLGSYIANMSVKADFPRIVLGVGMMSLFVVVFNHFLWQPLYNYTTKKFQIT